MKTHNFSAGPSILPQEVFKEAAEAVLNYNNLGLSILEISHRSPDFIAILEEAQALTLDLLSLNTNDYSVLFLQGGASMEFLRIPMNLLNINGKAGYLDTGTWAYNAFLEAQKIGTVEIVASSKNTNYNSIPTDYSISNEFDYFHCTSNNTIYGTQIHKFPTTSVPLVCDMSSDIFSRTLDFTKFDLIYAGAQKNIGPAGTSVIIIKKSLLDNSNRVIPSIMDYQKHINKDSMFNTPAVFAIYTSLLTMRWIKEMGGITAMEKRNNAKATLFYTELDNNTCFSGHAKTEDRSTMNATFFAKSEEIATVFDKLCKENNISGIKGHRSIGGYRASMYNAMELESVQILVDVMKKTNEIITK